MRLRIYLFFIEQVTPKPFFKSSLTATLNDHPTAGESNEMDLASGEGLGTDENPHPNVRCLSRTRIFR